MHNSSLICLSFLLFFSLRNRQRRCFFINKPSLHDRRVLLCTLFFPQHGDHLPDEYADMGARRHLLVLQSLNNLAQCRKEEFGAPKTSSHSFQSTQGAIGYFRILAKRDITKGPQTGGPADPEEDMETSLRAPQAEDVQEGISPLGKPVQAPTVIIKQKPK